MGSFKVCCHFLNSQSTSCDVTVISKYWNQKNADKIGWGLIKSCTSDQASTQKLFNSLVEECQPRKRVQQQTARLYKPREALLREWQQREMQSC